MLTIFAGRDPAGLHIVADVCLHNQENINNYELVPEEAHYFLVLLLQQYGLKLFNSRNMFVVCLFS
jgi:hypothetical protein